MNRTIIKASIAGALALLPLAALAQGGGSLSNLSKLVDSVGNIIRTLIPLLVAVALLVFFWGLIKYIRAANDPAEAGTGKSIMIAGVIALFVMVSVWGIVGFIGDAVGIDQGGDITPPRVNR